MTRHQLIGRSPAARSGHVVSTGCGLTLTVKTTDPLPAVVTAWHSDVDCPDCLTRSRT